MSNLRCGLCAISLLAATSILQSCSTGVTPSSKVDNALAADSPSADESPETAFSRWVESKQAWSEYSSHRNPRAELDAKGQELLATARQAEETIKAAGVKSAPVLLAHLTGPRQSYFCVSKLVEIGEPAVLPSIEWVRFHPGDYDVLKDVFASAGRSAGDKLAEMTAGSEADRSLAAKIMSRKFLDPRYHQPINMRDGRDGRDTKFMSSASQNLIVKAIKQESDETVKYQLVEALRHFEIGDIETTTYVTSLLKNDQSEVVRGGAAEAISTWLQNTSPTAAGEMTAALIQSMRTDQSVEVRQKAALALSSVKNVSPELIAVLRKAKSDPANAVRLSAMKALGEMAAKNPQCVADIIDELKDQDAVYDGLMAVVSAGPKAKAAVPAILASTPRRLDMKFRALEATGSDSPQIITLIMQTLELPANDQNQFAKGDAIRYLEKLGPKAGAPAIEVLRKLALEGGRGGNGNPWARNCLRSWGVSVEP